MRGVARVRVILDGVVGTSQEVGGVKVVQMMLVMEVMVSARDGDQEIGCVPGLDATSITLLPARSALGAKLQENLK